MKFKIFAVFCILSVLAFGSALACDDCRVLTDTDTWSQGGTWSQPFTVYSHNSNGEDFATTQGRLSWDLEASARGNRDAFADVDYFGNWEGRTAGAFQLEIFDGELSGAGAMSTVYGSADGYARGRDTYDCRWEGDDYADVDLTIGGSSYQHNGAYSDDRQSEVGGSNWSQADFWGQTDNTDRGTSLGVDGWDRSAESYDYISGGATSRGFTLTYARQTDNSALVGGITGNDAGGWLCNAENRDVDVYGAGRIAGEARLPDTGVAGFDSRFRYEGSNQGSGVAGGLSNVNIREGQGTMRITATSTGFSRASVGDNVPR
jgi:hypothetical protein